jgi:hypothetical protein
LKLSEKQQKTKNTKWREKMEREPFCNNGLVQIDASMYVKRSGHSVQRYWKNGDILTLDCNIGHLRVCGIGETTDTMTDDELRSAVAARLRGQIPIY